MSFYIQTDTMMDPRMGQGHRMDPSLLLLPPRLPKAAEQQHRVPPQAVQLPFSWGVLLEELEARLLNLMSPLAVVSGTS